MISLFFSSEQIKIIINLYDIKKKKNDFIIEDNYLIFKDKGQIYLCFDFLLDCFVEYGLDSQSEPTNFGKKIDVILEVLNHEFITGK